MKDYKKIIAKAISEKLGELSEDEIYNMVEVPADSSMGDYAFPCFKLAKELHKAPNLIASELAEKLTGNSAFDKVTSVNAYVNFAMQREEVAKDTIAEILTKGDDYGRNTLGEGKTMIVEFSSPNIAKPFHIGHIRSTVIGNSIYKILDFLGYDTVRINHLGDYGTQFGKMIVAYRRWGNKEDVERDPIPTLLSYYTKFHDEADLDPTLEEEARAAFAKLENGSKEEYDLWHWFREESLKEFNRVYNMLGITFDSYAGESFYSDKMDRVVKWLKDDNLLEESEGANIVNLEKYGMNPALITKSDGSTLYITRDIAAALYRKETYNFHKNIYVVASQQNLHFQQWFKIVELMGCPWAKDCVHIPFGLVSLADGTMSTRSGRVVFLEDVLNRAVEQTKDIIKEKKVATEDIDEIAKAVGIGAVVFNELSNSRIKDYVFSWEKILNFEGETGPYVQYTHARAASVIRNAGADLEAKAKKLEIDAKYLTSDSAYALVKLLYTFPDAIVEAGEKYEPSIVTRHIVRIAQAFNKFYHDEHILVEDENEKVAKLALVIATKNALKNGLGLLGMKAPERM